MHIYQTATPYQTTRKPVRATPINRNSRTIREAANGLQTAILATTAAISVIAWGMALSALIG